MEAGSGELFLFLLSLYLGQSFSLNNDIQNRSAGDAALKAGLSEVVRHLSNFIYNHPLSLPHEVKNQTEEIFFFFEIGLLCKTDLQFQSLLEGKVLSRSEKVWMYTIPFV